MQNAVIVDTLRTPLGKRNGRLKDWHPVDLAGVALRELVARTGIDDQGNASAEFFHDRRGGSGRNAPEPIRTRRGDGLSEGFVDRPKSTETSSSTTAKPPPKTSSPKES